MRQAFRRGALMVALTGAAQVATAQVATAQVATDQGATAQGLTVIDYTSYADPALHPAFFEEHGASPAIEKIDDEEIVRAKLLEGFVADLAHPCAVSVERWREEGLIEPIDPTRIARWDEIDRRFRDLPGFRHDGEPYFLPFDWGATALVHHTELAPSADVASLAVFKDPSYAGKIAVTGNVDGAFALAFLAIGVRDWATATDAQVQEASDFLRAARANGVFWWSDPGELVAKMTAGEITVAWAWNEVAVAAQDKGAPVEMKLDTIEGGSAWVCGYVRLANGSADDALAYDFLNAVLEPRVARALLDDWGYAHGNAAAMSSMDQRELVAAGFADPTEFRAKMLAPLHRGGLEFVDPAHFRSPTLWQAPMPSGLRERLIAEFDRIKSGS